MMTNWTPTPDQKILAMTRTPAPCCPSCAARAGAGLGNVGFTWPTFSLPAGIDQNTLLIGAGALVAAYVGYSLLFGGRRRSKGVAKAKAEFAQRYAAETGRFPKF